MKTKSFLMTLATVIVLLGCSSSKNFLGVQEEPKKVAPRPSNPSVGQPQNAADVLAKEPEKTTPKILRSYVEDQNYTQAIKEFQAALSQNPDAADINFYTAESYRKLGDLRASTP